MGDYISREAAVTEVCDRGKFYKKIHDRFGGTSDICASAHFEISELIMRLPAADVEPVRHGRWGKKQGGFWEFAACSLCGEKTPTVGITPNYFPNCGAKMDLEDETNDD